MYIVCSYVPLLIIYDGVDLSHINMDHFNIARGREGTEVLNSEFSKGRRSVEIMKEIAKAR